VYLRAPVHARDASVGAREQLGREVAERADHLWLDELDLPVQVGPAGVELVRLRVTVARRSALEGVADKHVLPRQPDLPQELVEQLAGAAYERQALEVLVMAGRLADEHQVGVRVAVSEDHIGTPLV